MWKMALALITSLLVKKFSPKEGRKLNKQIKSEFKVKGTKAYKQKFDLLCECVKWNGFIISTIVDSLRDAILRILDFVKGIVSDAILTAVKTF